MNVAKSQGVMLSGFFNLTTLSESLMAKEVLFEIVAVSKDPRFIDLTGTRAGMLYVVGYVGRNLGGTLWLCRCDCGVSCNRTGYDLRFDVSRSCGCVTKPKGQNFFKHGEAGGGKKSPEYRAYFKARSRCRNPNDSVYAYYGGRGIEFRIESFDEFLSLVGRRPSRGHSIDRIDSNGHYEAGNIRWATKLDQSNNRRNSMLIEIDGVTKTLSQWCNHDRKRTERARSRILRGTHCSKCAIGMTNAVTCLHV